MPHSFMNTFATNKRNSSGDTLGLCVFNILIIFICLLSSFVVSAISAQCLELLQLQFNLHLHHIIPVHLTFSIAMLMSFVQILCDAITLNLNKINYQSHFYNAQHSRYSRAYTNDAVFMHFTFVRRYVCMRLVQNVISREEIYTQ